MTVFRPRKFLARRRVMVRRAVFFPTAPTPRATTSCAHYESPSEVEAARKNVVACSVFQTPARTPGTLFRIRGAGLGHCLYSGQSFSGGAESAVATQRLGQRWCDHHTLNMAHVGGYNLEVALAVHESG